MSSVSGRRWSRFWLEVDGRRKRQAGKGFVGVDWEERLQCLRRQFCGIFSLPAVVQIVNPSSDALFFAELMA
jgi:hypothetical protein